MTSDKSTPRASDLRFAYFLDLARDAGCDWSGETFERAFAAVAPPRHSKSVARPTAPEAHTETARGHEDSGIDLPDPASAPRRKRRLSRPS
jgi:hypothetical protein